MYLPRSAVVDISAITPLFNAYVPPEPELYGTVRVIIVSIVATILPEDILRLTMPDKMIDWLKQCLQLCRW